ncbi:hypothetical protein B0J14DRAFT_572334 [Halenospora varia]|nr:hypothetical protein B0J14DRAFT_572334 [Halenospora varia]
MLHWRKRLSRVSWKAFFRPSGWPALLSGCFFQTRPCLHGVCEICGSSGMHRQVSALVLSGQNTCRCLVRFGIF